MSCVVHRAAQWCICAIRGGHVRSAGAKHSQSCAGRPVQGCVAGRGGRRGHRTCSAGTASSRQGGSAHTCACTDPTVCMRNHTLCPNCGMSRQWQYDCDVLSIWSQTALLQPQHRPGPQTYCNADHCCLTAFNSNCHICSTAVHARDIQQT